MIDLCSFSDLSEATIPGGTPPVRLHRLMADPDTGAATSLVVFPSGWRRDAVGRNASGEEFLVLSGTLHLSGITMVAGDYAWMPPGVLRWASYTDEPARVLAWFSGPGGWQLSSDDAAVTPTRRLATGHLGRDSVVRLRSGQPGEAQGTSVLRPGPFAAAEGDEVIDLEQLTWSVAGAGGLDVGPGRYLVRSPLS